MNIAQLSEQLKDVPQNRLVDYARNPNSVVPQFLALAEIQRRQQLSAQAQPPQSTVANDVLSQAAPQVDPSLIRAQMMQRAQQPQQPQPEQMAQQLPENQPGVAQLPSGMGQGFASGGIVAFAGGGLPTEADDEDDDREMAQLFPQSGISLEDIMAIPKGIGAGIKDLVSKLPQSYEATKAAQETAAPRGSHKYESAVLEEAKRQGVDPNLALHVLYKETGNLKDPENARSKAGAIGVMQLMPKTAAGLGVNPMDPMENIRGGISYLKQMADKYKDNRIAAAAYNAGPGNVDKALKRSGGLDTLSGETRNYIAGLAKGGVVGLAKGDLISDDAMYGEFGAPDYTPPVNQSIIDKWKAADAANKQTPVRSQGELRAQEQNYAPLNVPVSQSTTASAPPLNAFQNDVSFTQDMEDQESNKPAVIPAVAGPAASQATPVEDDLMDLRQNIKDQAASLAKQGKVNAALALLQTGFGMMASKSPYALAGIGEGAQSGVGTYAALKKQEADQAKDILGARLGLYKYGEASKNAAREYALKEKAYADRNAMSKEELQHRIAEGQRKEREYNLTHLANVEKILSAEMEKNYEMTPEQKRAAVYAHPMYRDAAVRAGIDMSQLSGGAVKVQNKEDYDKLKPGQQYIDPNGQLRTKG